MCATNWCNCEPQKLLRMSFRGSKKFQPADLRRYGTEPKRSAGAHLATDKSLVSSPLTTLISVHSRNQLLMPAKMSHAQISYQDMSGLT